MQVHRQIYPQTGFLREPSLYTVAILRSYKGSLVHFDSRVVCEFKRNTSKDNRLFTTLSLSSTVGVFYLIMVS